MCIYSAFYFTQITYYISKDISVLNPYMPILAAE